MKRIKKLLAAIVAVAMIVACLPAIPAFADDYSGSCGENAVWSFDKNTGVLTISGSGDMNDYVYDYSFSDYAPWDSQWKFIKYVNIENGVTSIGNCAFSGCRNLTSITIQGSVLSIGHFAFGDCSSLTSITIPDSVTSIGNEAFCDCSSLTSITIPDSVTSIGLHAFYNTAYYNNDDNWKYNVLYIGNHLIRAKSSISGSYTVRTGTKIIADSAFSGCSLTSITIPESVTSIGNGAFSGCSNLKSITIPESVTSIGNSAFSGCSNLKSITIPESVTSIGNSAFSGCSYLNSIAIPESVTSIRNSAFSSCSNLKSITIPESLTSIGNSAFSYCYSLTSITIPDSVTSIGESAFNNCSSLERVEITDISSWCNISFESQDSNPLYYAHNLYLNDTKLTNIILPNGITSIKKYVFSGFSSLTSIIIPNGVTSIGNSTFYNCNSLTNIDIPDGITSIGAYSFENCSSLTSITIPDGVTSIGDYAFYNCTNLTIKCYKNSAANNYAVANKIPYVLMMDSVAAPSNPTLESKTHNSVTLTATDGYEYKMDNGEWQDSNVFGGLNPNEKHTFYQRIKETDTAYASESSLGTEVTTLKMPSDKPNAPTVETKTYNSVTLAATNGYEYKMNNGEWQDSNVFGCLNPNKTYTLYQRVKETDTTYASESSLGTEVTTLKMPSDKPNAPTVETKTYNSVTLAATNGYEYKMNNGEWQSSNVFSYLTPNTTYTFYQRVKETDRTYASESSLGTKITTYQKSTFVETYGGNCGENARWSLDANTGILKIYGNGDMYDYDSLNNIPWSLYNLYIQSVSIENGITSIGNQAFLSCYHLSSVIVSKSVTSIGDKAFSGCDSLTNITIPNNVESIGKYTFEYCSSLASITIADSVNNIGDGAFFGCRSLESITIPNGVKDLGDSVFYNCTELKRVSIPNSVTSIEDYAFKNCKALANITIPDGVKNIGNEAFYGCIGLTYVTIPNSVARINNCTFLGCGSLESITIPDSVTHIGDSVFADCESLINIAVPDNVLVLGEGAFDNTAFYNNVSNWKNDILFIGNHLIEAKKTLSSSYDIPAGTKTIAGGAFKECGSLTSVTIPDSVKTICYAAFAGCINLTNITVSYGNDYFSSENGVLFNKDKSTLISFGAGKIGAYNIPSSVTRIGDGAFAGCNGLESITIPVNVTSIGYAAFEDCISLENITISDSVTSIGEHAFHNTAYYNNWGNWENNVLFVGNHLIVTNKNISGSYTVSERTKTIADYSFRDCSYLTSITIPRSVNSIGENIFSGCNAITIKCFNDSTAYNYAVLNNIPYSLIKDTVEAPLAPTVATKSENSVTLAATDGYEYKMDNGEWQDSNVFGGLNPNKTYTFYQRVKETDTAYASESSLGTKITTPKKSADKPTAPTVATKTHNSVTLKNVAGCEYSMDKKNWQTSNVFNNLKPETEYTFYQRTAETGTTYASESSAVLKVKTEPRKSLVNEKGVWYYKEDGKKVNTTTLFNYYGVWYYVENGKVNFNATTLYKYYGTWYYVEKGKVNFNATTLCNYYGTWYYVEKGKANFNATTLCKYGNTWYYVEKGKVNFNATTLCKYGNTWYYIEKGKVNFNATTLCKYGNTWYYVQNGKVNFNATTLCKYGNTWYYVHNGRVNFNATLRFNYYGKYYNVRNGVVRF